MHLLYTVPYMSRNSENIKIKEGIETEQKNSSDLYVQGISFITDMIPL